MAFLGEGKLSKRTMTNFPAQFHAVKLCTVLGVYFSFQMESNLKNLHQK